ncbi:hypothetical protein ACHAPK_009307 [Fusarium culmorum]
MAQQEQCWSVILGEIVVAAVIVGDDVIGFRILHCHVTTDSDFGVVGVVSLKRISDTALSSLGTESSAEAGGGLRLHDGNGESLVVARGRPPPCLGTAAGREAVDGRGACSLKTVVEATPPETVPEENTATETTALEVIVKQDVISIGSLFDLPSSDDSAVAAPDTAPEDVLPTADDAVTIEMETDDPVPVSTADDSAIAETDTAEPIVVDAAPTEEIQMNNTDITVTRDTAMDDPVPIATTDDGNVTDTVHDDQPPTPIVDAHVTDTEVVGAIAEDSIHIAIDDDGAVVGTTVQR